MSEVKNNSRVQSLDTNVVDQIAAGEVLERPAHMVKELIENALDAGATELEIHISDGGRSLVLIDNGIGFHPSDLELALQRHTTSKLKEASDLWSLSTYGFRGEALASIAAVSNLTITTKREGEVCVKLKSKFGVVESVIDSNLDRGTKIEVSDLYENTPARLKFLKTDASEFMEIKKVIYAFGLCQPQVSIKLFHKEQMEFYWPGVATSTTALTSSSKLLNKNFDLSESELLNTLKERSQLILNTKELYILKRDYGDIQIEVHFAPPHETVRSNRRLWTFVQNRWVQEPMILSAIRDGFQNTLLPGEYPIGAIFINVPSDFVDVNVHPTKSKVKFKDQSQIYRAIRQTLIDLVELSPWRHEFLQKQDFTFNDTALKSKDKTKSEIKNYADSPSVQSSFELKAFRSTSPVVERTTKAHPGPPVERTTKAHPGLSVERNTLKHSNVSNTSENRKIAEELFQFQAGSSGIEIDQTLAKSEFVSSIKFESGESLTPAEKDSAVSSLWSNLIVIGQAHKTYIITQNQNEMIFVDQHAAHERYLFEKLWQDFKNGKTLETQRHLIPLTFKFEDEAMLEAFLKNEEQLKKIGIGFEQSGPKQIELIETPAMIKDKAVIKSLTIMTEQMLSLGQSFILEDIISDIFASMACHSAIRAGQILTQSEMEELLDLMDEYPTTSYCPHGRPVFVRRSFYQIEKDFCRKV